MRFKQCVIFTFCAFASLQATTDRTQKLDRLLAHTFIGESSTGMLEMIVEKVIHDHPKTMDRKLLIEKLKEATQKQDVKEKLNEIYASFTNEEIEEIERIFSSPVYHKFLKEAYLVYQKGSQILENEVVALLNQFGTVKEALPESDISEITEANFYQGVILSSKPVVIDFYSDTCPPCRMLEPVFAELSSKYKDSFRFVRINCTTEKSLAEHFKIKSVPTILFVKPNGDLSVEKRIVGFKNKQDFENEIAQLQLKQSH